MAAHMQIPGRGRTAISRGFASSATVVIMTMVVQQALDARRATHRGMARRDQMATGRPWLPTCTVTTTVQAQRARAATVQVSRFACDERLTPNELA